MRPGKNVSRKARSDARTIEVCTATAELRELALVSHGLLAHALALLDGKPDPRTFALLLVEAREWTRRARDLARAVDDVAAGRLEVN